MNRLILENRNRLWAGLLNQLNADVARMKEEINTSGGFRMADFLAVFERLTIDLPEASEVVGRIVVGLKSEQISQVLSDSPIPGILESWVPNCGHFYTTAELHNTWKEWGQDKDLYYPFKSAGTLGRHLANAREPLEQFYGLKQAKRYARLRHWRFSKVARQNQ